MICISDWPFEVAKRSDGVCTMAGANGAYDLGLGCRSCTAIGAGLGTATAVDISSRISFRIEALPEHDRILWTRLFVPLLFNCLSLVHLEGTNGSSLAGCVEGSALATEASIVQYRRFLDKVQRMKWWTQKLINERLGRREDNLGMQ